MFPPFVPSSNFAVQKIWLFPAGVQKRTDLRSEQYCKASRYLVRVSFRYFVPFSNLDINI